MPPSASRGDAALQAMVEAVRSGDIGRLIPFDTYNSFYRPGAPGAARLRAEGGVPA